MNKEELIQFCEEEFLKNINKYIKSETIFVYVDNLEKENKKQKELLNKIKEELNNLYNADQSERNYKVFIEKVDKLLEEIE